MWLLRKQQQKKDSKWGDECNLCLSVNPRIHYPLVLHHRATSTALIGYHQEQNNNTVQHCKHKQKKNEISSTFHLFCFSLSCVVSTPKKHTSREKLNGTGQVQVGWRKEERYEIESEQIDICMSLKNLASGCCLIPIAIGQKSPVHSRTPSPQKSDSQSVPMRGYT